MYYNHIDKLTSLPQVSANFFGWVCPQPSIRDSTKDCQPSKLVSFCILIMVVRYIESMKKSSIDTKRMMINRSHNWIVFICILFLIHTGKGARGQISVYDDYELSDDTISQNHTSQSTDDRSHYDISQEEEGDAINFDIDETEVVDLDSTDQAQSIHSSTSNQRDPEIISPDDTKESQSTESIRTDQDEIFDLDILENVELADEKRDNYSIYEDDKYSSDDTINEKNDLESTEKMEGNQVTQIIVEDYLASLSEEDLKAICFKRGFDISRPQARVNETNHEYFVEAARRCINIEKEIDAIIAQNPDLAAELEAEIDRMIVEKERLESERQNMINQISLLESQLRDKGMSLSSPPPDTSFKNVTSMSAQEVLEESFGLLWDRVFKDIKLLNSVLSYVTKPLGEVLFFVWRYSKPTIEPFARSVLLISARYFSNDKVTMVTSHLTSFDTTFVIPILHNLRDLVVRIVRDVAGNKQFDPIFSTLRVVLGPVYLQLRTLAVELKRKISRIKDSLVEWATEALEDSST